VREGQLADRAIGQARHFGQDAEPCRRRSPRCGHPHGVGHGGHPAARCLLADGNGAPRTAGDLPGPDLLVQCQDGVQEGLGGWRAPRCVDVDRHDLVDALDDGVVVEHAPVEAHTPMEMTHLGSIIWS